MDKVLVIGASGQLGTELTLKLREIFGTDNVIASDLRQGSEEVMNGPFEELDIMNESQYHEILTKNKITQVYHLAALLSARAEDNPQFAWKLNMNSLLQVLESGRDTVKKIYWPSSIAVFGPDTPSVNTPQHTIMNPTTVYGISKLAGERWCEYYHNKYGVDVRSIRYPGLIGYKAKPGGGTTDYAVDIFWKLAEEGKYTSFLSKDTELPMMFMEDAVRGTVELMESDSDRLSIRSSYNFAGVSFTPEELAKEIRKTYPDFVMDYAPDQRQAIADSWPKSIDDSFAREEWDWKPKFDLTLMTQEMIQGVKSSLVKL